MDRRNARERWIFPLALEPLALEPNEYLLRMAALARPSEDGGDALSSQEEGDVFCPPGADDAQVQVEPGGPLPPAADGDETRLAPPRPRDIMRAALARLAEAWRSYHRTRIRRRAMRVAMWRFSRLHPHWYDAMFDETFLSRMPAASLRDMEASVLAREWTRQFRYHDVRRVERDARLVSPVAESFLALLRDAEREEGVRDAPVGAGRCREGAGPRLDGCPTTVRRNDRSVDQA